MASTQDTGMEEGRPQPCQFGPFYLQELINSGGMADIWLATDAARNVYALRKLRDARFMNFTEKKRFIRGCEVLSKIQHHEYIISYVDHGKVGTVPYLLTEYLESSNLKQLISRSDPILHEFVGNILIDCAEALDHMHNCGYMHLDFKPENILVTRNGSVRLVDFDLSIPKPDKPKKTPDNPGTPAYMAPEQLARKPFDHRADIFAFGVTAYELLTFRKPFPGDSAKEILRKQLDLTEDLISPREYNSDIPADLEKIVTQCLALKMKDRYHFASYLVRDLKQALYVE